MSNLTKMAEKYPNGKKTLWEMEKLLVLFPQCFQKACFPEASKGVWEWVKNLLKHKQIQKWADVLLGKLCTN